MRATCRSTVNYAFTMMMVLSLSTAALAQPEPAVPPEFDLYAGRVWSQDWTVGREVSQQFTPASSLPEAQRPPLGGAFESFGMFISSDGSFVMYVSLYQWNTSWMRAVLVDGPIKTWRVERTAGGVDWGMLDLTTITEDDRSCISYPALTPLAVDGSYLWDLEVTATSANLRCWSTGKSSDLGEPSGENNVGFHDDGAAKTWAFQTRLRLVTLCSIPHFDVDADLDVDQADFSAFQLCYTGTDPGNWAYDDPCKCLDVNEDNYIDQADYLLFDQCASGPGIAADETCDD